MIDPADRVAVDGGGDRSVLRSVAGDGRDGPTGPEIDHAGQARLGRDQV